VTVITQVLVDKKDPAFKKPTKPIGPYYKTKIEKNMIKEPEGWRKIVASPKPKKIIEIDQIKSLIKNYIVIACGGGGVPIINEKGLKGVEAVIDKDFAASLIAREVKADLFIILTNVPRVYLNYGQPDEKPIPEMTVEEAKNYLAQGHFPPGSMGPKIEAAIEYIQNGGEEVLITSTSHLKASLINRSGTKIIAAT